MTRHFLGEYGEDFCERNDLPVLSGIIPGVMAQTGMETAEIVKGVVDETKPDMVLAIDALAARNVRRLASTIQLTDTGIHPGSGVGNHRHSMTKDSLGVPVAALGIPTVVGAAAIVHGTVEALIHTLAMNSGTEGYAKYMEDLDPESQYELIRELMEPEFGPMFVTPDVYKRQPCLTDRDESVWVSAEKRRRIWLGGDSRGNPAVLLRSAGRLWGICIPGRVYGVLFVSCVLSGENL